ncbi:type II toxin-antitoxin system VapC family toxin [Stieleria sp. ICT_E10.1]|uniref:type II toxin-antitoxin system VapC family toxin n=1 Tax=Stieleria sedimenti TaxID=2976331 RepID=UPI0021805531|nr:type II toxin-antitoxin system VapC family toxin [Stieleria sedimenti]MCS7471625.1 type II toxin-antitoxin system VapC family toxin [Stieleria sedimenti]
MDTVYIETTVIGSIAGRLHPNPLIAARQQASRVWWSDARTLFRLFVSQLVVDECLAGDSDAAQERIDELVRIPRLQITEPARELANALMDRKAIPESEPRDALHIGIAAVHGVQYLVTWNFKHIANATLRDRINNVCRDAGHEPPIICTPEEIAGMNDESFDTY